MSEPFCPIACRANVSKVLEIFGGKWSFLVLDLLFSGTKRYNQLHRQLPQISSKALSDTLRHLESHGIVDRRVYATTPVTVEYSLTPKGIDFQTVLHEMDAWGIKWLDDVQHEKRASTPEPAVAPDNRA
ncbi:winged helix-turn-helix transcriptional regulator [Paenibacillus flagellatus]|uniref:Transcriptional regulator n=1 Tax=Paenibacillus flagellatus TaxID=2211139 RepID=A0A2V5KS95_9BACL|nr:helix-turn-helix domain-containing protein [Paenibacillus flagellatus]PYI54457.1 transcriptional regulator [Paenibacillus flagellatus]